VQPDTAPTDDAQLAAAFRELHGARLHGFTLLLTLGDRSLAERLAAFSLAAGARQAAALRHPERAAAWLRARALREVHRQRFLRRSSPAEERRSALAALGVGGATYRGLAALSVDARAALVASAIEQFDPIDVETILDATPAAARHAVAEARNRYLRSATVNGSDDSTEPPLDDDGGELARRVQGVAARAFSTGDVRR